MDLKGLYKVLSADANEIKICLASKEHAIFKAHFPGNPIFPGFIHLEIIEKEFNLQISTIKKGKFNEIIAPNAIIHYVREKNKFQVFINNKQVASFTF